MSDRPYVQAVRTADILPGGMRAVELDGRELVICNVDGTFYALDNICLHRGGPLGEGYITGDKVECPWHGWQFEVKTGCAAMNPDMKVETYPVKVEGSDVLVAV